MSQLRRDRSLLCAPVLILLLLLPGVSSAQFVECADGVVVAEEVNDPLGIYKYTLTIEWDTGTPFAMSHLDLLVPLCDCLCDDDPTGGSLPFAVADSAGHSTGETATGEPCTVYYEGLIECGDPSIPGFEGALVKFEPIESEGCMPGVTGTGTFCFYSDVEPDDVDELPLLLMKYEGLNCFGNLSGQLPLCPECDSNPVHPATWGRVKSRFAEEN